VGDLLDPLSIEKALDGVDKLYLLNAVPDELTQAMTAYRRYREAFQIVRDAALTKIFKPISGYHGCCYL
jgi:uncharacterized protein YbjT (DUF2867 family)